jgi:hypothetical protein
VGFIDGRRTESTSRGPPLPNDLPPYAGVARAIARQASRGYLGGGRKTHQRQPLGRTYGVWTQRNACPKRCPCERTSRFGLERNDRLPNIIFPCQSFVSGQSKRSYPLGTNTHTQSRSRESFLRTTNKQTNSYVNATLEAILSSRSRISPENKPGTLFHHVG